MRADAFSVEPDTEALMHAVETGLRHPSRVYFAPPLEARFHRDTAAVRCRHARLAAVGGIMFYDCFLLLDHLWVPQIFWAALLLRLGVVTPVALAFALWIGSKPSPMVRDVIQCLAGITIAIATMWLALLPDGETSATYQDLSPLTLLFMTLLSAMQFVPALIMNIATIAFYAAGLLFLHRFSLQLAVFFVLVQTVTAAFALTGNWLLHRAERRAYLLTLRETLRTEALNNQNRELLELSHTDALTGAANRRMFDTELSILWQGEPGGRLSVLLVDVDHFKAYNDRYGHQAGDRCLAAVAAIMQQQLRTDIDLLARYGGEEFAIVLPGADLADAALIAERVRRAVEELAIPHEGNSAAPFVTVSVGFSAAEKGMGRSDRLVDGADIALYAAKQAGRNRIAPPLVVSPEKALAHAVAGRRPPESQRDG